MCNHKNVAKIDKLFWFTFSDQWRSCLNFNTGLCLDMLHIQIMERTNRNDKTVLYIIFKLHSIYSWAQIFKWASKQKTENPWMYNIKGHKKFNIQVSLWCNMNILKLVITVFGVWVMHLKLKPFHLIQIWSTQVHQFYKDIMNSNR